MAKKNNLEQDRMDDLLDQLLAGGTDEASLGDAMRRLRKRGIERHRRLN